MVALLLSVLVAIPSPSPTPPLKTIITVKSSPMCGAFAAHVNAAIGSTVGNDQTLGTAILGLRSSGLAGNVIERNDEIQRLGNLADSIYHQFRIGENEVNQLRSLAGKVTDPAEKAAVLASANALGGALYRQHLIQRDLDGFLAFLNASDMTHGMDPGDSPGDDVGARAPNGRFESNAMWAPPWQEQAQPALMVGHETPEQDVQMAVLASKDFQRRIPAIMLDEMTAGANIEQASNHC